MKIATWNLDHASNSSRPIAAQLEQMRSINADIWVLTETCEKVNLKNDGYTCITPNLTKKYHKYWSTIWSRWPMHQIKCYEEETPVSAQIETPEGNLIVYGTIIPYHGYKGPIGESRKWVEHEKSIVEHGNDWKAIQYKYAGIPFIVAGDFNQTRDGSGVYCSPNGIKLLNEQLDRNNLICITDEDFGVHNKFMPDPKKDGRYRHNVDHICVSRLRFAVEHVGVWDHFTEVNYLSDHNGVYTELTLS